MNHKEVKEEEGRKEEGQHINWVAVFIMDTNYSSDFH